MSLDRGIQDQDQQAPSLHEFISSANHPLLQGPAGATVTTNEAAPATLQHAQHKRQKTSHISGSAKQIEEIKEGDKKEERGQQAGEPSDQDEEEEEFCGPALELFFDQQDAPEPLKQAVEPDDKGQEKDNEERTSGDNLHG